MPNNFTFKVRDFTSQLNSAPTQMPTSTPAMPKVEPWKPEVQKYNQDFMKGGFLKKVGDVLSYPSMKLEEWSTGGKGYEQHIEKLYGAKNTPGKLDMNDAISTGYRLIADPLNVVPVGKAASLVGKIPGVSKLVSGVSKVAKAAKNMPIVQKIAPKFINGYGVADDVVRQFKGIPEKATPMIDDVITKQQQLFKDITPEDVDIIAKFLEPKGAGKGTNLNKLKAELGEHYTKVIKPIVDEERKIFRELATSDYKRGNISIDSMKSYVARKYMPHQFEPQKQGFLSKARALVDRKYADSLDMEQPGTIFKAGSKVGVKQNYYKARKGAEGFITNVPEVTARRQIQQIKDNVVQDAIRYTRDNYGMKLKADGSGKIIGQIPAGYAELTGTSGRLKDLAEKGYKWVLPKAEAEYLDQTLKEGGTFSKAMDAMNRVWKPIATSYNPGFHLNNMIGNMYNSFLGGVSNPKRYFQMVAGGFTPDEDAIVKATGILSRGEFARDMASETFKSSTKQKVFGTPQKIGAWVENNARKALFLDAREKFLKEGASDAEAIQKAIDKVDEFLFNYQTGLSPFEQNVMKRFFPFYSWFRSNVPLQAKSLVTQTGKPAAAMKLLRSANSGNMPEDMSVPIPGQKDDNGKQQRWRVPLPLQDISAFGRSETARDMLSPFLKLGVAGANYALGGEAPMDYYTGKPLTNKQLPAGVQVADVASATAKNLVKPVRTVEKIAKNPKSPANWVKSLAGGVSSDYGKDKKVSDETYAKKLKNREIQAEITRALKAGNIRRAKLLEKYLDK